MACIGTCLDPHLCSYSRSSGIWNDLQQNDRKYLFSSWCGTCWTYILTTTIEYKCWLGSLKENSTSSNQLSECSGFFYANHENAVLLTEEKLYLPCLPPHPVVVPAVLITVRINAGHDVEVEPFEQAPEWKTRNSDDGHRQISGGNPPYERSSDFG